MSDEPAIKAIETRYRGYRMRSRLEARWAIFFDALGVPWEYEVEGYDLGGEWYLPDFRLGSGSHVEIKPGYDTMFETIEKAHRLAVSSKHAALVLIGNPWPYEFHGIVLGRLGHCVPINRFAPCPTCQTVRVCTALTTQCGIMYLKGTGCQDGCAATDEHTLSRAFEEARGARFDRH